MVKMKVKLLSRVRLFRPHGLYSTRLLCPWDFPGNSTGVDCHFLLQGIFPNQGLNPGLPHCRHWSEPPWGGSYSNPCKKRRLGPKHTQKKDCVKTRRQPRGVGWGGRREGVSKGRDICIPLADSC